MDIDQQLVVEADQALVAATRKFIAASLVDRLALQPALERSRNGWAAARFRLLFPDSVAVQADVDEAKRIRARIDAAADKQQQIQALLDLASLLLKFAH